ncbi:MAG: histidine kinase dimerization/phospho-acceptor domain-containing protein, partial [Cyanobacteria bacterium P01_E01_bin.42]
MNTIGQAMNPKPQQPFISGKTAGKMAIDEWETVPMPSLEEISHELRTPLTSIQGALGLLLSGKVDPGTREGEQLLRIAANNTKRLLR